MSAPKSRGSKKQPILAGISPKKLPDPSRLVFNRTSELLAQLNLKKKLKVAILLRYNPIARYKELKKAVTSYLGQEKKTLCSYPLLAEDLNHGLFAQLLAQQPSIATHSNNWLDYLDSEDNSPIMLFIRDLVSRPQMLAKMQMRATDSYLNRLSSTSVSLTTQQRANQKKQESLESEKSKVDAKENTSTRGASSPSEVKTEKTDFLQLIRKAVESKANNSPRGEVLSRTSSSNKGALTKSNSPSSPLENLLPKSFAANTSVLPSLIFTADNPAIFDEPESTLDHQLSNPITDNALPQEGKAKATQEEGTTKAPLLASPLVFTDLISPPQDPYPSFFISFSDHDLAINEQQALTEGSQLSQLISPEELEEFNLDSRDLEELLDNA